MRIRSLLAATALLATAVPALAQTEPEEPPPTKVREIYAKETNVDLDGATIIGEKKVPVGAAVALRKGEAYPSMIEERVHFKRDLAKSAGFGIKKSVKATETDMK